MKQVDFDGTTTFLKVVSVNISEENYLMIDDVFSNDDMWNIAISCSCKNGFVFEIIDIAGRKVFSNSALEGGILHHVTISSTSFSKGIYLLKVSDGKTIRLRKFGI